MAGCVPGLLPDEALDVLDVDVRIERWHDALTAGSDTLVAEDAEAGFTEATLWVLDSNERARSFYERAGWRLDGSVRSDRIGELRTLVDEVRYRLTL